MFSCYTCGYGIMIITSPCHGENMGLIPVIRSKIFFINKFKYYNMPILKSAIKADNVSKKRKIIKRPFKSKAFSMYNNIIKLCFHSKKEEAMKFINEAYSSIDTAAKKNIIHKNKASRMKSRLAILV